MMRSVLFGLALVSVAPSIAAACSPPPCWAGAFLPVDGGSVPANAPGFVFRPIHDFFSVSEGDPANVTLEIVGGASIALTASPLPGGLFLLAPPAGALAPGQHYVLTDHNHCSYSPTDTTFDTPPASFTATAAVPYPTTIGTAVLAPKGITTVNVGTAAGSCTSDAQASVVEAKLELSADAAPWRDLLVYATTLDGAPWSGAGAINRPDPLGQSWAGRASDKVYHVCSSMDSTVVGTGAKLGTHQLAMHATLTGGTGALDTTAEALDLSCDPTDQPPGDDDPPLVDDTVDNGGCSTGGSTSLGGGLLGLGLVIRRRRRR